MTDNLITKALNWLRRGYPQGVPSQDTFAVMYVLKQQLGDADIDAVVAELLSHTGSDAPVNKECITDHDICAFIEHTTSQTPEEADIERVKTRLAEGGFPVE